MKKELAIRLRFGKEVVGYIRIGQGVAYISPICNGSECQNISTTHELIGVDAQGPFAGADMLSVKASWCPVYDDFDIGIQEDNGEFNFDVGLVKSSGESVLGDEEVKRISDAIAEAVVEGVLGAQATHDS